jgi:DNA-binding GntR family transcriptional regulator
MPARDAIKRLKVDGKLIIEPFRGVRVPAANLKEIKGLYASRRHLETRAARRLAGQPGTGPFEPGDD